MHIKRHLCSLVLTVITTILFPTFAFSGFGGVEWGESEKKTKEVFKIKEHGNITLDFYFFDTQWNLEIFTNDSGFYMAKLSKFFSEKGGFDAAVNLVKKMEAQLTNKYGKPHVTGDLFTYTGTWIGQDTKVTITLRGIGDSATIDARWSLSDEMGKI